MASQLHRSTIAMRTAAVFLFFLSFFLALLVPATASAVTVPEIVTLSKAGVSDAVLVALIDRDKQLFSIDADEIVALRREGVSEPVVLAMLKSGREQAATVLSAAPEIVIVGHDPERPNTTHEFKSAASLASFFVLPYVFTGPVGPINGHGACVRLTVAPAPPQIGRITSNSVGHITSNNVGSIWTPLATTAATPVSTCEPVAPRTRVRPRR